MTILPFHLGLLPQAGELLARRHQRDRAARPELSASFADPVLAQAAIQASLGRSRARGYAALDGDQLVAYLLGDMVFDATWGRSAWVRMAGCAYDPSVGVEVVRDLYAALGADWVAYGVFTHYVQVPPGTDGDPTLVQAWFSLSFGLQQVYALADLAALQPVPPAIPQGVEVCRALQEDKPVLEEMSDVIWKAHVQAPVWAPMLPETIRQTAEGWAGLLDEADVTIWLAKLDGRVVGLQSYWPAESAVGASGDHLHIPQKCVHMSVAGTRPEARRKGISSLLTRYGLAWAYKEGYAACDTDWRSANLPAARFWPRQGFHPSMYRLARTIDPAIAWANGQPAPENPDPVRLPK